jgi:fatty acid desaturase
MSELAFTESFYLDGVNRRFAWKWLRSRDQQRHVKDMRAELWRLVACVGVAIAGILVLFIGVSELDKARFFSNRPPFTLGAVLRCDRPY